jgi:transcription termination factor NusB
MIGELDFKKQKKYFDKLVNQIKRNLKEVDKNVCKKK